jgi:excisionase family DNA binding protein
MTSPTGFALLWSKEQTRAAMGISARLLTTLAVRGEIPSVRIGSRRLFRPEAVRAWIEAREQKGGRAPASARPGARPAAAKLDGGEAP